MCELMSVILQSVAYILRKNNFFFLLHHFLMNCAWDVCHHHFLDSLLINYWYAKAFSIWTKANEINRVTHRFELVLVECWILLQKKGIRKYKSTHKINRNTKIWLDGLIEANNNMDSLIVLICEMTAFELK